MVSSSWKYLSFGLLAVLAAIFSIPQASAHITSNTQHMLQHIYNFVDGIEAKTDNLPDDPADQSLIDTQLESIQSDTDDIQTGIDNLSPGASPKAVRFNTTVDPPNSATGIPFIEIIPRVEGRSYSGHISMQQIVTAGNFVTLICSIDETSGITLTADSGPGALDNMNEDFTCDRLEVQVGEAFDGVESGPITISGLIQYFESDEVTSVSS